MHASMKAFLVCLNHANTSQHVLDEATIIKFLKSFNDIMFSPKQLGSFKVIAKKKNVTEDIL